MMKIQSVVRKGKNRTRQGKGFSRSELEETKIDFKRALKLAIPIDLRRKTKHQENVKIIKEYLRKMGLKSEKKKGRRITKEAAETP